MTTSREFLELVLSGEPITGAHLDELVQHHVKEDELIEFKPGQFLKEKDTRSEEIRRYVSGFANVSGGVLLIGIDIRNHRADAVTGCDPNDVGGDLAVWGTSCISDMGASFYPVPKFIEVESTSGAKVLVCAVARSYNTVRIITKTRENYYFRIGDETRLVTDDLLTDLLMGRRARPILEVTDWGADSFTRYNYQDIPLIDLNIRVNIQIENAGLVWAEQSRWGVIAKTTTWSSSVGMPLGPHLRSQLEIHDWQADMPTDPGMFSHFGEPASIEKPFDVDTAYFIARIPLQSGYGNRHLSYSWMAAMYLVAKNSNPIWYQLRFRIGSETIPEFYEANTLGKGGNIFSITRLHGTTPVVGWIKED